MKKYFSKLTKLNRLYAEKKKEFAYMRLKFMHKSQYPGELAKRYERRTGKPLDWQNLRTFNEKMQWIKLYDTDKRKTILADKYLAREWVMNKIGKEYLIPLLGVWDSFAEIDFDKLPGKFVLKANHGSGWNMIVTDKNNFNKSEAKKKFDKWMKHNFSFAAGLQMHYKDIKPKIIAEQFLEGDIYDLQIWCFSGSPAFIAIIEAPHGKNEKKFYSTDWVELPFVSSLPISGKTFEPPHSLKGILDMAAELSKGFKFVRVDFLVVKDTVKFNEMTFTPANGYVKWYPPEVDSEAGDLIQLST